MTTTPIKVYLAGPMSIVPEDFNCYMFEAGAKKLRDYGFEVFSPWEADLAAWGDHEGITKNATYRECMRKDLIYIIDEAEGIVMLPGWQDSRGAKIEKALAEALGLPVFYFSETLRLTDSNQQLVPKQDESRTETIRTVSPEHLGA